MTERLADAELESYLGWQHYRQNALCKCGLVWPCPCLVTRIVDELRELLVDATSFARQHNEQQELLDHYREENARLRAALQAIQDVLSLPYESKNDS